MKKSIGAKTIVFPTPVFIVGTYDQENKPNAMTVAWGGICCSKPPCVAVSMREATYTYQNLKQGKVFTISIPSEQQVREADYFGIASGRDQNKFQQAGLTPVKSEIVNAPYVEEFPFVLECRVLKEVAIGLHTQFIGEILDIKASEDVLDSLGKPDIEKIQPLIFDASHRRYFGIGRKVDDAFSIGREIGS